MTVTPPAKCQRGKWATGILVRAGARLARHGQCRKATKPTALTWINGWRGWPAIQRRWTRPSSGGNRRHGARLTGPSCIDRERREWGKSEVVRVDLGGYRIIQK